MKYIITETQNLFLRRRLDIIDSLIDFAFETIDPKEYNFDDYKAEIGWRMYDLLDEEGHDVTGFQTEDLFNFIFDKYGKRIKKEYSKKTKSINEILSESENDNDKSNAIRKVVKYFLNETELFADADVEKIKNIIGDEAYAIILYIDKKTAVNMGAGYGPSKNRYIMELKNYLNLIFPDLLYKFFDIHKEDRDRIQL